MNSVRNTLLESYAIWAYSSHSELILSKNLNIPSQSGVQQGDPLGMTLFAVAISEPLQRVQSRHPAVSIIVYADDIFIVGDPVDIEHCAIDIKSELEKCSLKLNTAKSMLWPALTNNMRESLPLLQTFKQNDSVFEVLGVPIAKNTQEILLAHAGCGGEK